MAKIISSNLMLAEVKNLYMENSKWIVVNIGCIECGVSSNIVGVFESKEKAEEVEKVCSDKFGWREGGQNSFEVFELPTANVITDEYAEAFK